MARMLLASGRELNMHNEHTAAAAAAAEAYDGAWDRQGTPAFITSSILCSSRDPDSPARIRYVMDETGYVRIHLIV
jgi:hypothetical protein